MEPEVETRSYGFVNPLTYVSSFLASYGWFVLGGGIVSVYLYNKLSVRLEAYLDAKKEAQYHKDPDMMLGRMEAIQRARDKQQQLLEAASQRARELEAERAERKKAEMEERLEKYGNSSGGQRLGSPDDGYLPLSGGGGGQSSYRPPKRSACGGGGCGR